jgi:hypothetical protein
VWRRQARDVREQYRCGHRQAGADPEHAGIDADLERANREAAGIAADHDDKWPSQHHAEHGAGATENQALCEQRAPERAGAGAERGSHGQLAFAAHRAGEDQIGDVGAGNDEHDGCRGQQHEQNRPRG